MPIQVEKRKFPRVPTAVKIRYHVLSKSDLVFTDDEAVSRDLSAGGLALALSNNRALSAQDMVRLEVLDGSAVGLRAYAEVAWSKAEAAGLRFMGILDEDVERIKSMIRI